MILLVFSIESSHNQPYNDTIFFWQIRRLGRVAVRREKPAVNLPQPSATISSQARSDGSSNEFLAEILVEKPSIW